MPKLDKRNFVLLCCCVSKTFFVLNDNVFSPTSLIIAYELPGPLTLRDHHRPASQSVSQMATPRTLYLDTVCPAQSIPPSTINVSVLANPCSVSNSFHSLIAPRCSKFFQIRKRGGVELGGWKRWNGVEAQVEERQRAELCEML